MYREMKKSLKDWTLGELQELSKEMAAIKVPIWFSAYGLDHNSTYLSINIRNIDADEDFRLNEILDIDAFVLKLGEKATCMAEAKAVEVGAKNLENKKRLLALPSPLDEEPTI